MTGAMTGFRCWTVQDVRETVYSDIGALSIGADAVFLAAHTPMGIRHTKGTSLLDAGAGERQVLQALTSGMDELDRNTVVAVIGASGTGKSHIVRWVHAHLDRDRDEYQVLYVPRAIQTLRELLRRLVTELPGVDGGDFLKRVDAAVGSVSEEHLADKLLEEMRGVLTWSIEERPPVDGETEEGRTSREERNSLLGEPDEQGKRRDGLADLLALPELNKWLLRADGLLREVARSGQARASRRDEQHIGFSMADLPVRNAALLREARTRPQLHEILTVVRNDPGPALAMLDEALQIAAPRAFGMRSSDGDTLESLFIRSRRVLREQGRQLVLVFEDLAQFGLVDGELYDQFVTPPGADLAPLRVLFAITDSPFVRVPETVKTRITHEFWVYSDALADRKVFLARYLNLVRLGRRAVENDRNRASPGTDAWVRNACDTREDGLPCRFRDACHSDFGAVDVAGIGNVGLYPYNHYALERGLAGPAAKPAGEESVTPRRLLDTLITDELLVADMQLQKSTYPYPELIQRFEFRPQLPKGHLLAGQQGELAERYYRALVLWGAEQPLAPAVAEAFDLTAVVTRSAPPAGVADPVVAPAGAAPVTAALPVPRVNSPLPALLQWQNLKDLPDKEADVYRSQLVALVRNRIQLDQDLFHVAGGDGQQRLADILNLTTFHIVDARGRRAGKADLQFDIEPEDSGVQLLFGTRWLYEHGHWSTADGTWDWQGYSVDDVMVAVESQLDEWAEAVRSRFHADVRGRGIARAALGVNAIALLAFGVPAESLATVNDVLRPPSAPRGPTIDDWPDAELSTAIRKVRTEELVGGFAAVRQGPGGAPQLVDGVELEDGLREAVAAPAAFLRATADTYTEIAPTVAEAADGLLKALDSIAANHLAGAEESLLALRNGLAGCVPAVVADNADRVAHEAFRAGLFRPVDGWRRFGGEIEKLRRLPLERLAEWHVDRTAPPIDGLLRTRPWLGVATAAAGALRFVQECLDATVRECARRGRITGDVERAEHAVRDKFAEVRVLVQALTAEEIRD